MLFSAVVCVLVLLCLLELMWNQLKYALCFLKPIVYNTTGGLLHAWPVCMFNVTMAAFTLLYGKFWQTCVWISIQVIDMLYCTLCSRISKWFSMVEREFCGFKRPSRNGPLLHLFYKWMSFSTIDVFGLKGHTQNWPF